MAQKIYASVGNFGFSPGPKGLSIYEYNPDNAEMNLVGSDFSDVNVGHQCFDSKRNILYIVNETPSRRGETGGGGYIMAIRVDPDTGKLTLMNEKETLAPEPAFICMDKSGEYILVCHHADHDFVTKIQKDSSGRYSSVTMFDDAALVLFRIKKDGSLGDICDVHITPGQGVSGPHMISHQHSVVTDPSGELFIVCDKGLDKIHTFHLDREHGRIVPQKESIVETGLSPRYGVFHPELPLFYMNNEKETVAHAFRYDVSTGMLEKLGSSPLLLDDEAAKELEKVEASDILIHPSGKYLYVSVRGTDCIAILDIDEKGHIKLRDNVHCGGQIPRGICISPDARFLFAANMKSGNVASFSIEADGGLKDTGNQVKERTPGNMIILQ